MLSHRILVNSAKLHVLWSCLLQSRKLIFKLKWQALVAFQLFKVHLILLVVFIWDLICGLYCLKIWKCMVFSRPLQPNREHTAQISSWSIRSTMSTSCWNVKLLSIEATSWHISEKILWIHQLLLIQIVTNSNNDRKRRRGH